MEDLQVLTQTWSGPLVVAMQILLILLVAWLLQRLVRRTVTVSGSVIRCRRSCSCRCVGACAG